MITPTGNPNWARTADITDYGGSINKKNYLDAAATNPDTDVTAEQYSRLVDAVAAMNRIVPFCVMVIDLTDGTIDTFYHQAGNVDENKPTIGEYAGGKRIITFPESYVDSYNIEYGTNITVAQATSTTSGSDIYANVTTSNTIDLFYSTSTKTYIVIY